MSTPTSVFNFHGNISPTTTSTPRSLHDQSSSSDHPIPSPASTVASLTRDLEDTLHNLDLEAAQRGLYVVKPQVFFLKKSRKIVCKIICAHMNIME